MNRDISMAELDAQGDAFFRVLVPLDGSDATKVALDYARQVPSDEITLLRVHAERSIPLPGRAQYRRRKNRIPELQAELEAIAAPLREAGRNVRTHVEQGDVAETIVDMGRDHDLVVMTTHGRGAAGRAIFGSIADRVSRHSEIPVLLIRRRLASARDLGLGRIVVPLDGSTVAERSLPFAVWLAKTFSIPLHVFRALDLSEVLAAIRAERQEGAQQEADSDEEQEVQENYDRVRAEVEANATEYLMEHVNRLRADGIEADMQLLHGTPAYTLLWHMQQDDLTVMTSHGRGGYRRWAMGSVAEKLVREAEAPVLLVPQRGAPPPR